jgi:uncharacterized membrane protein HdeD (DUF308 family)
VNNTSLGTAGRDRQHDKSRDHSAPKAAHEPSQLSRYAAHARQEATMASNPIQSAYRRTWWSIVLRGIFGVALGAIVLSRPIESIASFALVIAIWALFTGVVQIVHAFDLRAVYDKWWVMLLGGLVSATFGVAALYYYPVLSLAFAVVWATWWLFLTGGLAIYAAVQERRLKLSWGWTLTFGIVAVVTGVLAIMNPPTTLVAIMGLIAGFAIVSGVLLLIGAFRLTSVKDDVTNALRSATRA